MQSCCVIGLGYIGLPTAVVVASTKSYSVIGVDINPEIVKTLNAGKSHISEHGLSDLLLAATKDGTFCAQATVPSSDIYIIAVPTPLKKLENSSIPTPDISFVEAAALAIASKIKAGDTVIIESTCPIGTTLHIKELIALNSNLGSNDFHIGYCPERVLPGNTLFELIHNDRTIGGDSEAASDAISIFYQTFCKGRLSVTTTKTAEMIKLTENSYRDVNIAFANELSLICGQSGIDVYELIKLANHHPRVNILNPGCGVGGHCIAVDPWFLVHDYPDLTTLIQSSRRVNDLKASWVVNKILGQAQILDAGLPRSTRIGCLGITFKPNTDDIRESPALAIVKALIHSGYNVNVCEPNLQAIEGISLRPLAEVLATSDLIVVLVGHSEFLSVHIPKHKTLDFCGLSTT